MCDVIQKIKDGIYAYPESIEWGHLFKMLSENLGRDDIPLPLILGGSIASDFEKNKRLIEQIIIAEENGLVEEAIKILFGVPEDHWVKSNGNLDKKAVLFEGDL